MFDKIKNKAAELLEKYRLELFKQSISDKFEDAKVCELDDTNITLQSDFDFVNTLYSLKGEYNYNAVCEINEQINQNERFRETSLKA